MRLLKHKEEQIDLQISSIFGVILSVTAMRTKAERKISPVAKPTMKLTRLFSSSVSSSWGVIRLQKSHYILENFTNIYGDLREI